MEKGELLKWPRDGYEIRALWFPEFTAEKNGEQIVFDAWIWFYGQVKRNRWFAFAISDHVSGTDPDEALVASDVDELQKMAIFLGRRWEEIWNTCPHCVASEQRLRHKTMPRAIYRDILLSPDDELEEDRANGEGKAILDKVTEATGTRFSMN